MPTPTDPSAPPEPHAHAHTHRVPTDRSAFRARSAADAAGRHVRRRRYPLLSLNFFFRFAFAAYKSVFAFFCMAMLGYGAAEVGVCM